MRYIYSLRLSAVVLCLFLAGCGCKNWFGGTKEESKVKPNLILLHATTKADHDIASIKVPDMGVKTDYIDPGTDTKAAVQKWADEHKDWKDVSVITYCLNDQCSASEDLAKALSDFSTKVKVYKGGLQDWVANNKEDAAKYPVTGDITKIKEQKYTAKEGELSAGDLADLMAKAEKDAKEAAAKPAEVKTEEAKPAEKTAEVTPAPAPEQPKPAEEPKKEEKK